MKSTYKRGFTLIELLVVIAIIGILSSIVLASLNSARQKGRDARRLSDIKQIQLALELYYDAHGVYPASTSVATLVTPGYISVIPTDPTNGAPYSYAGLSATSGGTCSTYHLGASLETTGDTALSSDADETGGLACSGSAADFVGTDVSGTPCAVGDAGSECYDVTP